MQKDLHQADAPPQPWGTVGTGGLQKAPSSYALVCPGGEEGLQMHTAPRVTGRTLPAVLRTPPASPYLWGDGGPPASRPAAAGPSAVKKKRSFSSSSTPI